MEESQAQKRFFEYIRETALPELKKGNAVHAEVLQQVFLLPDEWKLQMEIAAGYERLLSRISAKKLIRISEECRNPYDRRPDGALDWSMVKPCQEEFPYLTKSEYSAVLKFGTFMECGYDRQWCMEALDGREGTLAFFFLRLNDWVGAIRESAYVLAKKRMLECGAEEFFHALPMLEKVKDSGRRREEHLRCLEELVKELGSEKIRALPDRVLIGRLPYYEVHVKNAVYRLLSQNKILEPEQMEQLEAAEWMGYGKELLLTGIFCHYGYEKERMERYLNSRSALVRGRTLLFRYEKEQNAWAGLERMLLDCSRRIRRYAGFILEKHTKINVLDYYLEALRQNAPETALSESSPGKGVLCAALFGIGEHGTKKEIQMVAPFLESGDARTAKAALTAYGRLAAEEGEALYWKFLFDPRPAVAKTAYRLIGKYQIHYGAHTLYQAYCKAGPGAQKNALLRLLLCEPSWERLPYLLALYEQEELLEQQRQMVRAGVGRRHVYATVSKELSDAIREALDHAGERVSGQVRKGILFDLEHVEKNA